MKDIAINAVHNGIGCATNTSSVLSNYIQHRLDIRRRAGDDAQNLARRCLLLQRFFEFVEQPHVLNGDHCLVSEGLHQLDLRRCEGTHLGATCEQSSDQFVLLTKGNNQERPPATGTRYA